VDFTLETLFGRISLLRGDHFDEAKAARLLCVRVAHDVALLNLAILFKETRNLFLGERRMNARDEEVGTFVAAFILLVARSWRRTTVYGISEYTRQRQNLVTYRLSRSLGDALRARESSTSRRSPRGDLLRSRS
jgi:hypothetical protein